MKIIAIANHKGGVGKTTTAINLSVALAKHGKKILVIDLDPQANLTYSFNIDTTNGTIVNLLQTKQAIQTLLVNKEDIYILPSEKQLADLELTLTNKIGRENILKENLKTIHKFDYIFIDCPPSLGLLTINALNASSEVLIPVQVEVLSLMGLAQLFDTISQVKNILNKKLEISGIIPFMFDARRNLSSEILQQLKIELKQYCLYRPIRECVKIAEAPSFGKSIFSYAPGSNGAKDFLLLAKQFLSMEDKTNGNRQTELNYRCFSKENN